MTVFKSILVGLVVLAVIVGLAVYGRKGETAAPYASLPAGQAGVTPVASPSLSPTASLPAGQAGASVSPVSNTKNGMHEITISTNYGDIVFRTYDTDAPKAAGNFVTLANKKFYDKLVFHRVIKGFMIQGGDPKGDGTGGPGYSFADELNPAAESYKLGYVRGAVAMANSGPNTNGSQFFIMHQDYQLPHNYTIFGHVVRGQDVVDKIATSPTGANDRPVTPVIMKSVTVRSIQ